MKRTKSLSDLRETKVSTSLFILSDSLRQYVTELKRHKKAVERIEGEIKMMKEKYKTPSRFLTVPKFKIEPKAKLPEEAKNNTGGNASWVELEHDRKIVEYNDSR